MIAWIKSHLVDDLSAVWQRWSVKIVAAQVVIIATYAGLSAAGIAPTFPEWEKHAAFILLSAAALTASWVKQKAPDA